MKFYNNNERFGDCGPIEASCKEAAADFCSEMFEAWAHETVAAEQADRADAGIAPLGDDEEIEFRDTVLAEYRAEFIRGLSEEIPLETA